MNIFVSYRRDDSGGYAGRLADDLADHFGKRRVFRDIDSIGAGADFGQVINSAVAKCEALVAVIGPEWLNARSPSGGRRIDDPQDFVRLEIAAGLERDILVVPVLVDGAEMPRPDELPPSLAKLARYNAVEMSDHTWPYGLSRLIQVINDRIERSRPGPRWLMIGVPALVAALLAVGVGALLMRDDGRPVATVGAPTTTTAQFTTTTPTEPVPTTTVTTIAPTASDRVSTTARPRSSTTVRAPVAPTTVRAPAAATTVQTPRVTTTLPGPRAVIRSYDQIGDAPNFGNSFPAVQAFVAKSNRINEVTVVVGKGGANGAGSVATVRIQICADKACGIKLDERTPTVVNYGRTVANFDLPVELGKQYFLHWSQPVPADGPDEWHTYWRDGPAPGEVTRRAEVLGYNA